MKRSLFRWGKSIDAKSIIFRSDNAWRKIEINPRSGQFYYRFIAALSSNRNHLANEDCPVCSPVFASRVIRGRHLNLAVMLFNFNTIGNRRVGTQMRIPLVGCVLLAVIHPSFAQKLLTTEPSTLDPYAVVFVNDGSCSAGKVLKVTGAIRGQHRKKSCVLASAVSDS
jgi:hypothetical protein